MGYVARLRKHYASRSQMCPYCGSKSIRRSRRRNLWEKMLSMAVSLHPYRCLICDKRYFGIVSSGGSAHTPKGTACL
jgi:DNA-directed RNA polymerase subunit RPC12/RpoP